MPPLSDRTGPSASLRSLQDDIGGNGEEGAAPTSRPGEYLLRRRGRVIRTCPRRGTSPSCQEIRCFLRSLRCGRLRCRCWRARRGRLPRRGRRGCRQRPARCLCRLQSCRP